MTALLILIAMLITDLVMLGAFLYIIYNIRKEIHFLRGTLIKLESRVDLANHNAYHARRGNS